MLWGPTSLSTQFTICRWCRSRPHKVLRPKGLSKHVSSLEDLAHAVGCDRTYVGRMLRLTSLAPDIIEAILRGDEPDGLSLEKLRKNLPVRWDEQRKCWQ